MPEIVQIEPQSVQDVRVDETNLVLEMRDEQNDDEVHALPPSITVQSGWNVTFESDGRISISR